MAVRMRKYLLLIAKLFGFFFYLLRYYGMIYSHSASINSMDIESSLSLNVLYLLIIIQL